MVPPPHARADRCRPSARPHGKGTAVRPAGGGSANTAGIADAVAPAPLVGSVANRTRSEATQVLTPLRRCRSAANLHLRHGVSAVLCMATSSTVLNWSAADTV